VKGNTLNNACRVAKTAINATLAADIFNRTPCVNR
jgi:hypothetical protein